jgi:hypothetical protein
MATPSFDLLVLGQQRIARVAGPAATQKTLTQVRLRLVHQVFNDRRLVYRNRVETNRKNLLLSSIEHTHHREQASQRLQKHQIITDLTRRKAIFDSGVALLPSYQSIDLPQPKDLYRFGVRVSFRIEYSSK